MSFIDTLKQKVTDRAPADKYVVWVVLALAAMGTVAVYSAITYLAEVRAGTGPEQFLVRHLIRVGIAFGVMGVVSFIDYRTLARYSRIGLIGALLLLLSVKIMGLFSAGSDRWLEIAGFGFQPSDLARVALVFYVAVLLVQKQDYVKSFSRAFLPILVWVFGTILLIGIDDLSTSAVLLLAVMLMCFVGRVSAIQIGGLGILGAALAVVLIATSPHRAARLEAYLGVNLFDDTSTEYVMDPQGEQYQSRQARIAFAVGGFTGVGPGKSIQRDFLPAPYNDFIFAIIAEEYGMVGALLLLLGFCVLLFRGYLRIARDAPDPLGLVLAVGFTTLIVAYGFVHAAVSCGLLPVTGLPMPFVSYGGTSMVANGIMVGVLLNISRQSAKRTPDEMRLEYKDFV
ncbi:cell division protein FtsW [Salinibacter sp. 10B]|uniref:FtsW/RodA/SpoVE family cell cycle protein n=1 Tax=Salinibacter sp. 10B TaxID=1923971 RepID=UPI000CF437DF|nr:putative peptidoglycan glycosyltransferase FtsW [Salinibacter sp. 10B]PQJ35418.1 cell division protein FtsW [Salinibacter sp. 10B]